MTIDEIRAAYPQVTAEDVRAASRMLPKCCGPRSRITDAIRKFSRNQPHYNCLSYGKQTIKA